MVSTEALLSWGEHLLTSTSQQGLSTGAIVGLVIGISLFTFIFGAVLTFYLTRRSFLKQLKENPPITEKMIRVMFLQMGVKASEARIKQVMRSMQNAK